MILKKNGGGEIKDFCDFFDEKMQKIAKMIEIRFFFLRIFIRNDVFDDFYDFKIFFGGRGVPKFKKSRIFRFL